MFFPNTHGPQLTAPFYSILFETSICQFNRSKCSPIIPDEFREHLTRSEIIPSSRITPDPLDSQLHDGASSLQFTSLIFYRVQDRGMVIAGAWFCAQWPIIVLFCVWIIVRLEDPNMAHYKISNRVSHLLVFYLLVFDRIHDAMCLNKMSRTSSRNIGPQHEKYSIIFHCTHGVLFISVFTKP